MEPEGVLSASVTGGGSHVHLWLLWTPAFSPSAVCPTLSLGAALGHRTEQPRFPVRTSDRKDLAAPGPAGKEQSVQSGTPRREQPGRLVGAAFQGGAHPSLQKHPSLLCHVDAHPSVASTSTVLPLEAAVQCPEAKVAPSQLLCLARPPR